VGRSVGTCLEPFVLHRWTVAEAENQLAEVDLPAVQGMEGFVDGSVAGLIVS
jgi:hypothetical protein